MTNKQYRAWERTMHIFGKLFHCHKLAERSFHIRGVQLPLCARCTGIVFGLMLGPILCIFLPINMFVSIALVLVMAFDGFTQYFGLRKSKNILRLFTGLGYGYAIVSFIFHIVRMSIMLAS